MPEPRYTLSESKAKRQAARPTIRGVVGATVLGLVGIGILDEILVAVIFRAFGWLAVCLGAVAVTWFLTRHVTMIPLRFFLRAFAFAAFLWPFIPHRSVEWSSPWPPASYSVVTGLRTGHLMLFETVSILAATLVMWLAGSAVYHDRHRPDAAQPTAPPSGGPVTRSGNSRATEGPPSVT
jgi:hypothetical protein